MTNEDRFDRDLAAWFAARAVQAAPSGLLDSVLATTAAQRPKPTLLASLRVAAPARAATARLGSAFLVLVALIVTVAVLRASLPDGHRAIVGAASPSPSNPSPSTLMAASPNPTSTTGPEASGEEARLLVYTGADDSGRRPFVWIANEDGSNAHLIGGGGFISWSPSGRYLLATADHGETVFDTTGETIGTLPYGSAVWSPDDHLLVGLRAGNGGGTNLIRLYDITGSLVRNYPAPAGVTLTGGASWAPDGRSFVVAGCESCDALPGHSPRPISSDLWIIAADGSGATKITESPIDGAPEPDWSPDGTSISYSTFCHTAHEVCRTAVYGTWLIAPDGSNPRMVLSHISGAAWSPDGSRLLYSHGDTPLSHTWVFVSQADGSDPIQLTSGPGEALLQVWAPADRVAYLHRDPGTNIMDGTVLVTRADGSQSQPDVVGSFCCSFGWQP